jgi:hypothetical protein
MKVTKSTAAYVSGTTRLALRAHGRMQSRAQRHTHTPLSDTRISERCMHAGLGGVEIHGHGHTVQHAHQRPTMPWVDSWQAIYVWVNHVMVDPSTMLGQPCQPTMPWHGRLLLTWPRSTARASGRYRVIATSRYSGLDRVPVHAPACTRSIRGPEPRACIAAAETQAEEIRAEETQAEETGGRDTGGRESGGRDTGGRDTGGRDTGGRSRTWR